jgi:hypothetical protein
VATSPATTASTIYKAPFGSFMAHLLHSMVFPD